MWRIYTTHAPRASPEGPIQMRFLNLGKIFDSRAL